MNLTELLSIGENTITTIVGSGGKTTLMMSLAKELRQQSKVLVTTTTKIYVPFKEQYDYLILGEDLKSLILKGENISFKTNNQLKIKSKCDYNRENNNGIYVYGREINKDNKLTSMEEENLDEIARNFDYVFIEADGSKEKPLKGWREDEPPVNKYTTHTIGVVDGMSLGLEIIDKNIHRIDKFLGKHEGKIDEEDFLKIIFSSGGLFNHSVGQKILFINKVDNDEIQLSISKLISEIIKENTKKKLLNKIIMGSLIYNKFQIINLSK